MNINIRKHIINNFKGANSNEIEESIDASINSADEVVLPGLGVLFEILWKNISDGEKVNILSILENNM